MQVNEPFHQVFAAEWDQFVREMTRQFKQFHHFYVNELNVPIYFFRYEDQTTDAYQVTIDLFSFMLNVPSLEGTVVERRIQEVTKDSFTKQTRYKLKSINTLNRNIGMYTDDQLAYIKSELKDFLIYFGYAENDQDPGSLTPFFKLDVSPEEMTNYNGFRRHNEEVLS